MKRLSVVILTWNEREELQECLRSLRPWVDWAQDEVVVFDNGSKDGTLAMVNRHFPTVRSIRSERNIGIAGGRNAAICVTNSRFVMTLDNDTRFLGPDPGAVIERFYRERPRVGVVGFKLFNYDGSVQRSARRFPVSVQPLVARMPLLRALPWGRKLDAFHLMQDVDWSKETGPRLVDYLIGANQIFERRLFDDLGGYDEKMFYGAEDCEFCLRARKAGYRNYYVPDICVEHRHKRRSRRSLGLLVRHLWSFYYMFLKHRRLLRLFP